MLDDNIDGLNETEIIREIIKEEVIIYLAGYVAHRFRTKYPFLGQPTWELPSNMDETSYTCSISRGFLVYPCDYLIKSAQLLEKVFHKFHKDSLSDAEFVFQKVAHLLKVKINNEFILPDEVLLCLIRTRTYIRLKELNKARKNSSDKIRAIQRSVQAQKFYS